MANKIIATVVGARPQFIKAAPVSLALRNDFLEVLIHTGQHYDYGMSDIFFEEMQMRKPVFHLGIGGGNHAEQTGNMLIELEKIFKYNPARPCASVWGYKFYISRRIIGGKSTDSFRAYRSRFEVIQPSDARRN